MPPYPEMTHSYAVIFLTKGISTTLAANAPTGESTVMDEPRLECSIAIMAYALPVDAVWPGDPSG